MTPDLSFPEFVRARWPALVRFAWTLVGDRHHAEDVIQVVLTRCWGRWSTIRYGGAEAYVRAAIVNEAVSRSRRLVRRPRETALPSEGEANAFAALGSAPRSADFTDAQARVDVIWQELHRLPVRMRAVVVLRFLEDLSEARTAEILGCSVGTVKSQTARAMSRLRDRAGLRELVGAPAQEEKR